MAVKSFFFFFKLGRYPSAFGEHVGEGLRAGLCVCELSECEEYKLSFQVRGDIRIRPVREQCGLSERASESG